jgi:ATP-dependent DNA ligase
MLARLSPALPEGGAWVFEPKFDGPCLRIPAPRVAIWSRNGHRLDGRFPQLVAVARSVLPEGVVDGELVVATSGGRQAPAHAARKGRPQTGA